MANAVIIGMGLGLMGLGVVPTPDDVTIISPLIQIGLGLTLVAVGIFAKGKD